MDPSKPKKKKPKKTKKTKQTITAKNDQEMREIYYVNKSTQLNAIWSWKEHKKKAVRNSMQQLVSDNLANIANCNSRQSIQ